MWNKISYYYKRLQPVINSIAIRNGLLRGNRDYQKFIILSSARVGSTLLQSYLNSHPKIFCEGEIYNTNHLKLYGKPEILKKQMNANPVKFLETYGFPKHTRNICFVGFKLFYMHFRTSETKILWERFESMKDIKIIHLKRDNLLRQIVSLKIAFKTNQWRSLGNDSLKENKQVRISKEELMKEYDTIEEFYHEAETIFKDHPIITVSYTDLLNQRQSTMDRIFHFLGTNSVMIKDSALKKQNPEHLSKLIENYESLKESFKGTKFETYFNESE